MNLFFISPSAHRAPESAHRVPDKSEKIAPWLVLRKR